MPTPARRRPVNIRLDSSLPPPADDATGWSLPADATPPAELLTCDAATRTARLLTARGIEREWSDPLKALHWLEESAHSSPHPDFRWVGFLSYDLGRLFESIPNLADDDLQLPLFAFTSHTAKETRPPLLVEHTHRHSASALTSNFTRSAYLDAVARAIEYIAAGDIFQVNLSQRFTAGLPTSPAELYDRLRRQAPAAYGACLDYGDFALLCNSPELFLDVTPLPDGTRRVTTRPIKGTRPRTPGMHDELLRSEKDQAELHMIVDLERNDLGRVCEIGTVRVTQPRTIEAHPTVYHGVATVQGTLRPDVTLVDLLRATFPGGSITGAPKIRAMQIIEELEPVRRGPYCGAIGSIGPRGRVQLNIAIRTMLLKNGLVHMPVGGGIVADSSPPKEFEETLVKARAMFQAVGVTPPQS